LNAKRDAKKPLLIVEDDPGLQKQLRWCFEGYEVLVAADRETALGQVRRRAPAVVTLDLGLPPDPSNTAEGFATLQQILSLRPQTKVIVVTGNDDRENAIRAVGMGAYDFYEKPIEPDILELIVARAYQLYELETENRELVKRRERSPLEGVIAASPEMTRVCHTIERVAPADVSVLLLGESGTGKEILARSLHEMSSRKDERFVVINCAAIPETLLESELFGYEKGAFTGALKQTIGKVEYADGGTLFMDEVGDLPQSLQAKLLRFLQERTIERLGGRQEISVDVRVICATHQDLKHKIQMGEFREDLFYRISEVTIIIPPLRERNGDSTLLAWAFLDKYGRQRGRPLRGFTEEAVNTIESYGWPGNVRELENCVKRAVIMAEGNMIGSEDLGLPGTTTGKSMPVSLREVREEAEGQAVRRALLLCDQKVAQAADMLGVSRPTLYDLMEKYGLK
jgi:two-component system NtrC family response regulator